MDNAAILTVNGLRYGGWENISVTRGIEQISGTFDLRLTERWPGQQEGRPIRPGEACTVALDDQVVITGYIDDVLPEYGTDSHTLSVTGRDRTGDLVDCSVLPAGKQWKNRTITQIASDLCAPFSVGVKAVGDMGKPLPRFTSQHGETAFEALERAARQLGVLLVSDTKGGLLLTRAGTDRSPTALVEGENILIGKGELSQRDRHSKYILRTENPGTDDSTPAQNTGAEATATDPNVKRYRPLIILSEDTGHSQALLERARWEANVRIGRGNRATITVQGWRHAVGLWQPNTLVTVKSPLLYLDMDMLIVSVNYLLGEGGTTCELSVCNPMAFELIAIPERKKDEGGWG